MNRRKRGAEYEDMVAKRLVDAGYIILERNFRCKIGEIDIIASKDGTLVFIEVKYRKNLASGYPEEAVSRTKQRRICLAADYYRIKKGVSDGVACRFDVVAIDGSGIRHYRNAFLYDRK